jgi:hypothetical protein
MKFTSEEYRVIRDALESYLSEGPSADDRITQKLLSNDFPYIPPSQHVEAPVYGAPLLASLPPADPNAINAKVTAHDDGRYFVQARHREPFKWYVVEAFAEHHLAAMLADQLQADPQERRRAIKEAKDFDFYANKIIVKREREPRIKDEDIDFSF